MASPRHPIPFPAIFDSDFVQCPAVALTSNRYVSEVTKKDGLRFRWLQKPKMRSGVFRLRAAENFSGASFATPKPILHHHQLDKHSLFFAISRVPSNFSQQACRGARLLRGHWHGSCASNAQFGRSRRELPAPPPKCSSSSSSQPNPAPSISTPTACCRNSRPT